jgi:hypothetical protein
MAGRELMSKNLPSEAFLDEFRRSPDSAWFVPEGIAPEACLGFRDGWALVYDHHRQRLLATTVGRPAWIAALSLSGELEWVRWAGSECCNFRCALLGPDVIVHGSSCGNRLTYFAPDGSLLRARDLSEGPLGPLGMFRQADIGVCVTMRSRVVAFDRQGERTWSVDAENISDAQGNEDRLYVACTEGEGQLRIGAVDIS